MDLPQTQKAARTASRCKMSSNRVVVSSIGFGPSSKDNKISPPAMPTASMDCQIVHCCRNLWMKEFKEFRSSGVQEFRSSGVQEFRSSGVQEFSVGSRLALQVKTRRGTVYPNCAGPASGRASWRFLNSCNPSNSFLSPALPLSLRATRPYDGPFI
jgi:hypothetical protein